MLLKFFSWDQGNCCIAMALGWQTTYHHTSITHYYMLVVVTCYYYRRLVFLRALIATLIAHVRFFSRALRKCERERRG